MKKIITLLLALIMMTGMASATYRSDLRWTYFEMVNSNINMRNGSIVWSGDADTYDVPSVTKTKITVKLQVSTAAGWGTIETQSYSAEYTTSAGGTYTDWEAGESFRVKVEAWCYNGTKELEHVGPFYDYLNT